MCTAILILASCTSSKTQKIEEYIADYADTPITVSGLTDEEFAVTPGDLAALELVTKTASGKTEKAGRVTAVGPTLDTFVGQYGKKQTDFWVVRFIASDGYRIAFAVDALEENEIIMSVATGSGALAEAERPLRLLVPDMESSRWIYAVERIEFKALEE